MNEYTPPPDADVARSLGLSKEGRQRRRLWPWFVVALVLLVIAGGTWRWFSAGTAPLYVTQPVARGPLTVTVSATGTLAPETEVDVGAEMSGRVDWVDVD